jgi:hypothetical protein
MPRMQKKMLKSVILLDIVAPIGCQGSLPLLQGTRYVEKGL